MSTEINTHDSDLQCTLCEKVIKLNHSYDNYYLHEDRGKPFPDCLVACSRCVEDDILYYAMHYEEKFLKRKSNLSLQDVLKDWAMYSYKRLPNDFTEYISARRWLTRKTGIKH